MAGESRARVSALPHAVSRRVPLSWILLLVAVALGGGAWTLHSVVSPPLVAANSILVVDLRHELPERHADGPLRCVQAPVIDVAALARLLESAARDARVRAVVLRASSAPGGLGRVEELRGLLTAFRRSGKPVLTFVESPDTLGYVLASAGDEIWLDRSSSLYLTGVEIATAFFKDLLAELGFEADLVRVGKFKGAYEQLTASEPSETFATAMDGLAESLYGEIVSLVSRSRSIEENRVRTLVDEAVLGPRRAVEAGLVDACAFWGEFHDMLRRRFGSDVALIPATTYLTSTRSGGARSARVALVTITGLIVDGDGRDAPLLLGPVTGAESVVAALAEAEEDASIDAIVLRIDSQGGALSAAQKIWSQVGRAASVKPVVASFGDAAASGGYYAACSAHAIVAQPGTLTGSIGLFGGKIVYRRFLEERGVRRREYSRGRHAGLLDPAQRYTGEERRLLEDRMMDEYREFIGRVAAARKLTVEEVEASARGRIWTGRRARERGLVDELGGIPTALRRVRELIDVPEETPVELVPRPAPRGLWSYLAELGGDGLDLSRTARPGGEIAGEYRRFASWARSSGLLDGRSRFALMPIWFELR